MFARIFLILFMALLPLGGCQQMSAPLGVGNEGLSQRDDLNQADSQNGDNDEIPTDGVDNSSPSDRTLMAGAAKPTPIETKGDSVRARPVWMLRLRYGPNLEKTLSAGEPPALLFLSGDEPFNLSLLMEESLSNNASDPWAPVPDGLQVRLDLPSGHRHSVTRLQVAEEGNINVSFPGLSLEGGVIRLYLIKAEEEPVLTGAFRLTRPSGIQNLP